MAYPVSKEWLDPKTLSLLAELPPGFERAGDCAGYSLLLLQAGPDTDRIVETVTFIQR